MFSGRGSGLRLRAAVENIGQAVFKPTGRRRYYVETAAFGSSRTALHHCYRPVSAIQKRYAPMPEAKYGFINQTNTVMRFERFTLLPVREADSIKLIKSGRALSVAGLEHNILLSAQNKTSGKTCRKQKGKSDKHTAIPSLVGRIFETRFVIQPITQTLKPTAKP